jgi:hypothetical protein
MVQNVWIGLTTKERALLVEALSAARRSKRFSTARIDALATKLGRAERHPKITIEVYRGQVEQVSGNPFPIRVRGYDGESGDLRDIDERGRACATWLEPIDTAGATF